MTRSGSLLVVLLGATALAFSPLLFGGFSFLSSWDDPAIILNQPLIRSGLLDAWVHAWGAMVLGVYEPLGIIFGAMVVHFGGLTPKAFHVATVGLHLINVALLFVLAQKLVTRADGVMALGLRPKAAAFVGAGIFAVHPMRVEALAWASAQSYVLSGSFFLISLLVYLRYCERVVDAPERGGRGLLLLALMAYFCAVASKSAAIFLPAVLLAIDRFPMRRSWGSRLWVEKLPFLLTGLGFAIAAMVATAEEQQVTHAMLDPATRIAYALHSPVFHLGKTLLPTGLHAHYALTAREVTPLTIPLVFSMFAVIAASGVAWSLRKTAPAFGFAWWIYLAGMIPVSGLVGHGRLILGADRYSYLPTIGIVIVVGAVVTARRVLSTPLTSSPRSMGIVLVLGIAMVGLLAGTHRQLEVWRSDQSLWSRTLEIDANNVLALNNLGFLSLEREDYGRAVELLVRAHELDPSSIPTVMSLGVAYQHQGRHRDAVALYWESLKQHPNVPALHGNLSLAYDALRMKGRAARHARIAQVLRERAAHGTD